MHEAFCLNDPCRSKVSIAELKSFVTADEDGTVQSRYNDTRLLRNQMRAFASNDLPDERFDSNCKDRVMSAGDFFSLLSDIFEGEKEKDVLAGLKRSIVFMFSSNALYLRLPSEHKDAMVHRICVDDIHNDLFSPVTSLCMENTRMAFWRLGPLLMQISGRSRRWWRRVLQR